MASVFHFTNFACTSLDLPLIFTQSKVNHCFFFPLHFQILCFRTYLKGFTFLCMPWKNLYRNEWLVCDGFLRNFLIRIESLIFVNFIKLAFTIMEPPLVCLERFQFNKEKNHKNLKFICENGLECAQVYPVYAAKGSEILDSRVNLDRFLFNCKIIQIRWCMLPKAVGGGGSIRFVCKDFSLTI